MSEENLDQQVMSPNTFTLNQRRKLQSSPVEEVDLSQSQRISQEPSKASTDGEVQGDPSLLQLIGQELVLMETIQEKGDGKNVSTTATPVAVSTPVTSKDMGSAEKEMGYQSSSSQIAVWEGGPKSKPLALNQPHHLCSLLSSSWKPKKASKELR